MSCAGVCACRCVCLAGVERGKREAWREVHPVLCAVLLAAHTGCTRAGVARTDHRDRRAAGMAAGGRRVLDGGRGAGRPREKSDRERRKRHAESRGDFRRGSAKSRKFAN